MPIHWVLVVDPDGRLPTQAFVHRPEPVADPRRGLLVWRWSLEVTFEDVRRHLAVETRRQWNDPAIAPTTPMAMPMPLLSLGCLMVSRWRERRVTLPRTTAWYIKSRATFSDGLALVRRTIWLRKMAST